MVYANPEDFVSAYDWEGGLIALLHHSGVKAFPPELQKQAKTVQNAEEKFQVAFQKWLEENDIKY